MAFDQLVKMLAVGIGETLYMTLISTAFAYLIGLPMGVLLVITDAQGIAPQAMTNKILGTVVNIVRSVPFLILMVALIPLARRIVGTSIGPTAAIVSLVIAAAPFVARLVEGSLREVDHGVIEAAQAMGASPIRIITRVLLPESKPSLLVGSAIAVTTILSYTAIAGAIGGGGLGAISINYGYYRYQQDIMLICVVLLVIIVQLLQEIGMRTAKCVDKKK